MLLFTEYAPPLLELFLVDLTVCKTLLKDIERGPAGRTRKATTATTAPMKTIINTDPKNIHPGMCGP
jgi:hypothetical protein